MMSAAVLDEGLSPFVEGAHGLPAAFFYAIGFFETEDGTVRWMPRRGYSLEATRTLHFPEAAEHDDFTHVPEAKAAYSGEIQHRADLSELSIQAPDGSSSLRATDTALTWTEDDLVNVSGTAVGPACRLTLLDPDYPMLYTSRPFTAAGTVHGRAAHGVVLQVTMHVPAGRDPLACPLLSRLQVAWVEFVNELADGSIENGMLVWGREGLQAVAVADCDGHHVASRDVAVDIDNDGGDPEFPRRIAFAGAGRTLTWDALARGGRWPARAEIPDGYRFRQGTVSRPDRGPDAVPARSYAFAETFQGRMA